MENNNKDNKPVAPATKPAAAPTAKPAAPATTTAPVAKPVAQTNAPAAQAVKPSAPVTAAATPTKPTAAPATTTAPVAKPVVQTNVQPTAQKPSVSPTATSTQPSKPFTAPTSTPSNQTVKPTSAPGAAPVRPASREGGNYPPRGPRPSFGGSGDGQRRGGDRRRPRRDAPEVKEFEERTIAINRVTKVVKGGKHLRFTALVVVGNGKGKYGFGTGKAGEVPDAIKKATDDARKNTFNITFVRANTIAHEVTAQYGACTVFLKPAPDGTGIIAGGAVRAVLELAGLKNIYSKVYGARSPINMVRATVEALESIKTYAQVKALRGK